MKNRYAKKHLFSFLANVLLSSIVFVVVTLAFIYYFVILNKQGPQGAIRSFNISSILSMNSLSLLLCLILGVIVFAITFILLDLRREKRISEIYEAIRRIAAGDITKEIQIDSMDEFSIMADNLNRMQIKIKELIENEKNSEKTKNELITNIAHDLRTPLTSVVGYLEILATNEKLTEDQKKEYLRIAFEKSKKLGELIEDLFSYTKVSLNAMSLKLDNFDIVILLNQLIEELYPLFEKNNLSFEFDSNVKTLEIVADPKLLSRLFENLLNNAIKYGKDGKRILIRLHKIDQEDFYVSIINYGNIIPKDSLEKLFERFYRVDESRNSAISGTGLGLAIAKNIVDMHRGKIQVTSNKKGTEFRVGLKINVNADEENLYKN